MPQFKTCKKVYASCECGGFFVKQEEVDVVKIQHMVGIALGDRQAARSLLSSASKQDGMWNSIYKLYYDVLHQLAEALLRFDNVKSSNHQCLFAYLCEKHAELELDWGFFEKIRTKRNGVQYYATPITFSDWKDIDLQVNIYIDTIHKTLTERLEKI